MATESLIKIKVDDDEFKAFLDAQKESRAIENEKQRIIDETGKKVKETAQEQEKANKSESKQVSLLRDALHLAEKGNLTARSFNELLRERINLLRQGNSLSEVFFGKEGRSFRGMAAGIAGLTAAKSIYSFLKNETFSIAQSATEHRNTSRVLGMTPGQLRAWEVNFSPYGDARSFLNKVSNAETNVQGAAALQRIGVDQKSINSGNTGEAALEAADKLRQFALRTKGPMQQNMFHARGLDQFYEDARLFASIPEGEWKKRKADIVRDSRTLNQSERAGRSAQEALLGAERLRQRQEVAKIESLAPTMGKLLTAEQALGNKIQDLTIQVAKLVGELGPHGALAAIIGGGALAAGAAGAAPSIIKRMIRGGKGAAEEGAVTVAKKGGGVIARRFLGPLALAYEALHPHQMGTGDTFTPEQREESRKRYQARLRNGNPINPLPPVNREDLNGLSERDRLLGAMAMQESRGDINAYNKKSGATGLLQVLPSTGRAHGDTNLYDPRQNIHAATEELKQLTRKYHGEREKIEAAYNWGQGNLDKDIKKHGNHWRDYLPSETKGYIHNVERNYRTNNIIEIRNYTGGNHAITMRQNSNS